MSKFLFDVQQKNRLKQKGLLRRFSIDCYGHQETVEEMRAAKTEKFRELKDKRGTREYEEWFLNYNPGSKPGSSQKQEDDSKDSKNNKYKQNKRIKKNKITQNKSKNIKNTKTKKSKNKRSKRGFLNLY
jgi:hypothetical protein